MLRVFIENSLRKPYGMADHVLIGHLLSQTFVPMHHRSVSWFCLAQVHV